LEIKFCVHCSRPINKVYLYCPFCGKQQSHPVEFAQILDHSLEPLRKKEAHSCMERLGFLLGELDSLEKEVSDFLEKSPASSEDSPGNCR